MGEWQPIETAPKATLVLVSDGKTISIAEYEHETWYAQAGGEQVWGPFDDLVILEPTHWMPLPNLPSPPKEKV